MDILDQLSGVSPEPVSLEQDATSPAFTTPIPTSALRNRAAIAAVLSDSPKNLVENYQSLMAQSEGGNPNAPSLEMESFFREDRSRDTKAVMSVLGNPQYTVEQKRGAIEAMKTSPVLKDSGTALLTRGLEVESPGETPEAEDARISTADALNEIYSARERTQGLVNAHGAQLQDLNLKVTADFLEMVLMPFATSSSSYQIAKALANAEGRKLSAWESVKAFTFGAGDVVMNMREKLASIPPAGQVQYTDMLLNIIKNNSGAFFSNDNQFDQFMKAQAIFAEGGYDNVDKFIDNASFLLDTVGLGFALRSGKAGARALKGAKGAETVLAGDVATQATRIPVGPSGHVPEALGTARKPYDGAKVSEPPMKLNPIADGIRRIDLNSVVRQENPASVANILQQANPTQARALHEAVFKSADDAVAQGVYGTTKGQALINDVFPQVLTESNSVTAKAVDIQRNLRIDPELSSHMKSLLRSSDVAIHYSQEEVAAARSNIINDFSHSTDLVPNDAMGGFKSGFKIDGSGIEISAVYGTKEGAFVRAEEALEQARYALRNQGIVDSDIEILRKVGLDYEPVALESVRGKDGNYLVRVNVRREVDPTDISKFTDDDKVRLNFFDRTALAVWNRTGSVSRWLLDAASMLPKRLTGAAVVATDVGSRFEKQMLDIATTFSDQYNKLDKARKAKVDEYIKEANFKGLPFDQADLISRGFVANEISTLRSWRDFWDAHYILENHDVVRTLSSQGYQMFKTAQTELYARPIAKNTQLGKIYDPSTGMVVNLSSVTIDDLYNKGGTIARLRRPTEFSFGVPSGAGTKHVTDTTEYMIVRNTPTEYLRKFRDSDQVLNYREGYYQIQYSAPRFVDEISLDANGKEIGRRAVAVAGDTKEAQHFAARQSRLNPDKRYDVRADDRATPRGSNDWFDTNSASGRIAQRHRGKLLEDATGINHLGDGTYIVNPVESAIRSAKSISGRTVSRPMLEAAKARAIQQYGDVFPSDGMGGRKFPSSKEEIGAKGKASTSHTADARTTWEYINYLENGYINTIDDFVKAQFNAMSMALGEYGLTKAERLAGKASELQHGPTGFAKNFVFQAYIGTNVLRNWIVQTNQILRTMAYNPQGWLTGSHAKLLGEYSGIKMGVLKNPSADGLAFTKFMDESGLLDSVDKQNLVRGSLLDAAGSSSKAVRVLGKAIELPRKVGFDAGESMNLLGHGVAVFDRWKRQGKDMTDMAVMREAHSEVRAISYDMNFAGDMPYNQTAPAALLQFMQVPHKAFLQATNRRIDPNIRARMLAADAVMWGVPVGLISTVMGGDIVPEDETTQELFLHGAQGFLLNRMFSELLGDKVDVDFSSLAPYDMDGWGKMFHAMLTGGLSQMINNSPAGQMFLADGGRVQSAIAAMSRFFSPWTPGERTAAEAAAVANEVAKIASGWNNTMKARQAFALGKSLDKYGNVIDPNVNSVEAALQLFGFGTGHTKALYETQRVAAEGTKAYADEVKQVYKDVKQYYQSAFGAGITDPKQMQEVTGQLLMAYKDSPVAMNIIQQELSKDITGKDIQLLLMMMKSVDIPEFGMTMDQIKRAPISDEQKQLYMERLEQVRNARSEINKGK